MDDAVGQVLTLEIPGHRKCYGHPLSHCFWIYFIQAKPSKSIKIGKTSGRLIDRLANLQTSCPEELWILSAFQVECGVDNMLEEWIHDFLADHRIRGEWFKPGQPVLDMALLAKAGKGRIIRKMVMPEEIRQSVEIPYTRGRRGDG